PLAGIAPATRRLAAPPPRPTTVGIFAADWDSEATNALLSQFAAACRKNDLQANLHWLHQNEAVETILAQCHERPEEAAFVLNLGSEINGRLYQRLSERGYRTVSTDLMPEGYGGDVVATDSRAAVRLGLDHLFSLGHQRIVLLVNEPIRDKSVVDKIDEFLLRMSEQGLSLVGRIVICGTQSWQNSYDSAYHHMVEVWDSWSGQRPTAIFTVSDPGAWAVLRWFRERGVEVPGEVSVMGFEDAASSAHVVPSLTTLAHPSGEAVARCLEVLTAPIPAPHRTQLIPPRLIVRDSTGAAEE
ncbi:MAG: LacI family DNA-binding transcriptional regulator, partial [Cytophagales bacterium]|nr:LacI family DNA-binding transcriptional regulator [Armatimonadota bacterium]